MESHLLQMRGLKPGLCEVALCVDASHLLQMRGLKLFIILRIRLLRFVASFTDAWIETIRIKPEFGLRFVASFTDAWIETVLSAEIKSI